MEINYVKAKSANNPEGRSDTSKILFAVNFPAEKHKDQRRKNPDKIPYINHPVGVADILIEEGKVEEVDWICAALLHDTIEDTDTTEEEITKHFGPNVASIVKELSDDKLLPQAERKRLTIVNAPNKSIAAKTVGMCDKIYNLRDLERILPAGWTEQRRVEYFIWSKKVVEHYYHANSNLAQIMQNMFLEHKTEMEELEDNRESDSGSNQELTN